MNLQEGGHAVKNVSRINQDNVKDTLEKIQSTILDNIGLEIGTSAKVLGSTGKRHPGDSSGDIDLAISIDAIKRKLKISDDSVVIEKIKEAIRKVSPDIVDNSKSSGLIHSSFPIVNSDGKQDGEKVQLDFMLINDDDLNYVEFGYWSPAQWESKFKGSYRSIALMMIASEAKKKVLETMEDPKSGEDVPVQWERMILDPRKGLFKAIQTNLSPKTNTPSKTKRTLSREFITNDPEKIIKLLLGKEATMDDANSFERIMDFIKSDKFPYKSERDAVFSRISEELMKQFKLSNLEVKEILQMESEVADKYLREASKGIDATKGVSHLEFIDDMIFNMGIDGLDLAIDTLEKILLDIKKEGDTTEDIHKSVKIDGAPSLYFGRDPNGSFFVSTKTIHNKGSNQKLGFSPKDIHEKWEGEIAEILTRAYIALKNTVKEKGIVLNGDLLFSNKKQKNIKNINSQDYLTFQPNTILYAMPKDLKSEIYKKAFRADLGIAIHGAFEGEYDDNGRLELKRLGTQDIIDYTKKINSPNVYAMHPFIPHVDVQNALTKNEEELQGLLDNLKETKDDIDPNFDEVWKSGSDNTLKKIKASMQKFLKAESIKDKNNIYSEGNIDKFIIKFKRSLSKYLFDITKGETSSLKTASGQEKKLKEANDLKEWIENSEDTFDPFIKSYFYLYNIKVFLLKTLNSIKNELGKTFVVDLKSDRMIATNPEGYVLLNGPHMVKIVDRAEFSKNNSLYSPFMQKKNAESQTESSKDLSIKASHISNEILEDILGSIDLTQDITGFNEVKTVDRLSRTKMYNTLWIGKFQPPTQAHINVLEQLSKQFNKVFLLVTDSGEYVDPELSLELIQSAIDRKNLKNVYVKIGKKDGGIDPVKSVFGISSKKPDVAKQSVDDIKKFFSLDTEDDDKAFVLSVGQESKGNEGEEDRFEAIKRLGTTFIVNNDEVPSKKKPFGLYGIPLLKSKSGVKIGARMIRELITDREFEKAKDSMAPGDEDIKDRIIDNMLSKIQNEEKYFDIEGFLVDKEIINTLSEEYYIDQAEAMDMILDILK